MYPGSKVPLSPTSLPITELSLIVSLVVDLRVHRGCCGQQRHKTKAGVVELPPYPYLAPKISPFGPSFLGLITEVCSISNDSCKIPTSS